MRVVNLAAPVHRRKRTAWTLGKGEHFATEHKKPASDLTAAMIADGSWRDARFKPYNFEAEGVVPAVGVEHTLLKVRTEFQRVLFEMGFEEMPTDRYVESCFWNFDALFQPQSHPARDAHDTFFVSKPAKALSVPEAYCERVKAVHESGGYGSRGYGTVWERAEADKLILRTHTTAVSSRMLFNLANQPGGFTPKRYFSIDRVFRNETLDATHLAEFHQVEGVIADYDIGLADLIGTIRDFFTRIGITDLRFKPAYNPYTEPSMEVFGYHPDLKRWTEIGNSGIFRPEMLAPMGLPEGVRVAAWGLSLERPTMIKYRYSNIRELFGHKVQVTETKRTPIVRF